MTLPPSARSLARSLVVAAVAGLSLVGLAVPAGASSVPGRLVVGFKAGAASVQRGAAVAAVHGSTASSIRPLRATVVRLKPGGEAEALARLRANPHVAYAERDAFVRPADVIPNDAMWLTQYSQPKVQAPRAWGVSEGSSSVVIAVLDSGVDLTHPDLAPNLVPGYDFFNNDSNPTDDFGHGTLAAGVAAGRSSNGVGAASYCGRCSIMPLKITGADGNATWSAMASATTYAVDHGARVISISFASTSGSTAVRDAIAYAHQHGAIVTVSAGNYGSNTAYYPAAYTDAVGVAATDTNDVVESYSNYGSWVKVAAPGCNQSTKRQSSGALFGEFCGTSSAAPAAAGMAGLALSYAPSATNTQIEQAMFSGAVGIGNAVQFGRVDAWGTLAALGASPAGTGAPASSAAPIVVGTDYGMLSSAPQPSQGLRTSPGRWVGAGPMMIAYQWQRCDGSGANCTSIAGATTMAYTPSSSDAGFTLRTGTTVSNSLGSGTAISAPTAPVGGSSTSTGTAPANTAPPIVSGTAQVGATVSASSGSWSGSPTAYTYQWQRCDTSGSACAAIVGATGASYSAASGDQGGTLRVVVTASNAYGSAAATSAATATVGPAPAAGPVTEMFTGSLTSRKTSYAFLVTVGAGSTTARLTFSKASQLTLTLTAADGSVVATTTGASGVSLTSTLGAGTYSYVVSGNVPKGSASFTLNVTHP
jgi:hypothetical protein